MTGSGDIQQMMQMMQTLSKMGGTGDTGGAGLSGLGNLGGLGSLGSLAGLAGGGGGLGGLGGLGSLAGLAGGGGGLGGLGSLGSLVGLAGGGGGLGGLGGLGSLAGLAGGGGGLAGGLGPLFGMMGQKHPPQQAKAKAAAPPAEPETVIDVEPEDAPPVRNTSANTATSEGEASAQDTSTGEEAGHSSGKQQRSQAKRGGFNLDPSMLDMLNNLSGMLHNNTPQPDPAPEAAAEADDPDVYWACAQCRKPCARYLDTVSLEEAREIAKTFSPI